MDGTNSCYYCDDAFPGCADAVAVAVDAGRHGSRSGQSWRLRSRRNGRGSPLPSSQTPEMAADYCEAVGRLRNLDSASFRDRLCLRYLRRLLPGSCCLPRPTAEHDGHRRRLRHCRACCYPLHKKSSLLLTRVEQHYDHNEQPLFTDFGENLVRCVPM